MKTWEISVCSVSKKENDIPWSYWRPYIHVRAFSAFWQCLTYSSLTKNNPYFDILYQKETRRVKVAEEPEQNLTETHLLSIRASKASSHHSSAQNACHRSCQGLERVICLMALAGQQSFSATALNTALGQDHPWSGHTHNRVGTQPSCKIVKLSVTFC